LLIGNYINRNIIGLNAKGIAVNAILAHNQFDCTSPLNGTNLGSFVGVQLIHCPSSAIGLTINEPTARNIFRKQKYAVNLVNGTTSHACSITIKSKYIFVTIRFM